MVEALVQWLERVGHWDALGVFIMVLLSAASAWLPIPLGLLALSLGAAFGLWAAPVVVLSAALSAMLVVLTVQRVLGPRVEMWVSGMPSTKLVRDAFDAEGWRIVALVRLAGIIPYFMQNYTFGLTSIRPVPFVLATAFAIFPTVALYAYVGVAGRKMLSEPSALNVAAAVLSAVALVAVVVIVGRRIRAALQDRA